MTIRTRQSTSRRSDAEDQGRVESIDGYLGAPGGSQVVRIEHVHVNEGGQALIGNVSN